MPTSTDVKDLTQLTERARACFAEMEEAEESVYRDVNLSNYRAWVFGKRLIEAKRGMEHGKFELWRAATFPKLHEKKAQRCQELFTKNQKATELSFLNERTVAAFVSKLEVDSLRKFRLGYFEKEKPENPNNVKFPRLVHVLKVINVIEHWKQRRKEGHVKKDTKQERLEFRPIVGWLSEELYADEIVTLDDGRKALLLDAFQAPAQATPL